MRRDQSIDDGTASRQPGERTDRVARHQTAVTGDASDKDRGEFAFTGWSLLGICVQRENSWPSLMAFTNPRLFAQSA